MFVRVVRFTDVDPDRFASLMEQIDASEGPPEGVPAMGLQILQDTDQGTSIVLQFFDSADDMQSAEAALDAMDPSDTPGTRASIDRCELVREMKA